MPSVYDNDNTWVQQKMYSEKGSVPKYVVDLNVVKLYRDVMVPGTNKGYTEEVDAIWRITNPEAKDNAETLIADVKILTGEAKGKFYSHVLLQKSQTKIFANAYKMCFGDYLSEWIVASDIQFASGDYGCAVPNVVDVAILEAQVNERNNQLKNKVIGISGENIGPDVKETSQSQWSNEDVMESN